MMNDEIDEQEQFADFTTASDWEFFVARLEEVIHEWRLPQVKPGAPLKKGELRNGTWETKTEKVLFADFEFNITRYCLKVACVEELVSPLEEDMDDPPSQALVDLMAMENDFSPHPFVASEDGYFLELHPLCRWYGLRDFVVLSPAGKEAVTTESKAKILLSSMCMAVNSSSCQVPVFVQIHQHWQHFHLGVCEGRGVRTEFEMVHLKRSPPHCNHLTGLLNVFKTKLASPLSLPPVTVSVRFTYILRDWTSNTWTQEPPDFDFLQGEVGVAELGKLPFGATFDPVSELHLFATWPHITEDVVVDNEGYSDFEPLQAPEWSVRVQMADSPACLLTEYLTEFIHLSTNNRSMHDILGDFVDQHNTDANLSASLDLLTDAAVPSLKKIMTKSKVQQRQVAQDGPISEDLLMPILYFLFPDALGENPKTPYMDNIPSSSEINLSSCKSSEEQLTGLKTAPGDGLVWRLAVVMAHVVHTLGGVKAAAHLWYEVTQELRFRWERNISIPGLPQGFPDHRTCLLHQKLQMLNCCVDRRRAREEAANAASAANHSADSDQELSSDDEFFDCPEEPDVSNEPHRAGSKRRQKHSLWNQPVGRLHKFGNLRLLETNEHLYIPITQEPPPKTEDQLEEDAEVLLQLGTDAQGSELRARMMSASLLSDMESFKAANPGAALVDFIRWYSPRDWVEEDTLNEFGQKNGHLSARMMIPGNTWQDVWTAAKPVPARRQKRLFDDTREAEKVLHFLDSTRPAGMAQLLLPVLTHAAICQLLEEKKEELTQLPDQLDKIVKKASLLSRMPRLDHRRYQELVRDVATVEALIAQANSLQHKFSPDLKTSPAELQQFLASLMQLPEVEVPGGPKGFVGSQIRAMFSEAQKAVQMIIEGETSAGDNETYGSHSSSCFPKPCEREFLLRVVAPRPATSSSPTPQRLYAMLKRDEFRLVGAFSQDTTFQ